MIIETESAYHSFCFPGANPHPSNGRRPLTEKQTKIFNLLSVGWSPSQIAKRIGVSYSSVQDGIQKIRHNGYKI